MSKKDDEFEGVPTTGHEWDGIREYDKPMPRWWLWTFYATMVWGLIYSLMFPAWPLINGATSGFLGWSSRADVEADLQAFADANAEIDARLASVELSEITADPDLNQYAVNAGAAFIGHGAFSVTGPARLVLWVSRTYWTTTGSGAVRWMKSTTRSVMAFGMK